jgi:hypothetical protein
MSAEHPPKKARVLTRLKITEVSAVDRGAGERCRIILAKRDSDAPRLNLIGVFQRKMTAAEALGIRVNKSAAGDEAEGLIAEPEHVVDNDGTDDGVPKKSITFDTIDGTRMTFPSERAMAVWLAAQGRVRKSTSEDSTMTSIDLSAIVKTYGVVALAKYMAEQNTSFGVTEEELTRLATEHATRVFPGDRPDVAFTKLYTDSSELRDAIEIAKSAALQDDLAAEAERDSREAMEELTPIIRESRRLAM